MKQVHEKNCHLSYSYLFLHEPLFGFLGDNVRTMLLNMNLFWCQSHSGHNMSSNQCKTTMFSPLMCSIVLQCHLASLCMNVVLLKSMHHAYHLGWMNLVHHCSACPHTIIKGIEKGGFSFLSKLSLFSSAL